MIGPDQRILLPAAFLAGGTFLVGADLLARTAIAPEELRLGTITSLIGVPFFLAMIFHERRATGVVLVIRTRERPPILNARHLHLQHEPIARAERRREPVEQVAARLHIRAGRNGDQCLSRPIHGNEPARRMAAPHDNSRQIDATVAQPLERNTTPRVRPRRPHHRDALTGRGPARRGERLVRALAALHQRVVAADDRFAARRQSRHRRDQIDVDRAEDDDHASLRGFGS